MALPHLKTDQDAKRVICHELGHWIMARKLGFDVGGIFIKSTSPVSGWSKVFPRANKKFTTVDDVADYLKKRVLVLLAGTVMEIEWYHTNFTSLSNENLATDVYYNGVIDDSGLTDKKKTEELLVVLAGCFFDPAADTDGVHNQMVNLFEEIYKEAKDKISPHKDKICSMVNYIYKEYSSEISNNDAFEIRRKHLVRIEKTVS